MQIYKKYIALNLLMPVAVVALTLTGIIWLSQSLRFIDLIVNKGLDVGTFLYLSILLIPSLLVIILPVSLFVSVLYVYNKFIAESELIVLKSSGISRVGLTLPALMVAGGVTILSYLISFYVLPASYREFKDMQDFIRNNYASTLLQEGVFSTPVERLTVYIESRNSDGILNGILVHDGRDPEKPSTMMAQEGILKQSPTGAHFELINGNRQEIDRTNGNLSMLYFDSYPLDLSVYTSTKNERSRAPEELYINELLFPKDGDIKTNNKLIAEGHHRITWPFFAITLALVALAVLFSGQFNRRGQWKRLSSATLIVIILIVNDLALKTVVAKSPYLAILLYINTVFPAIFSWYSLVLDGNIVGKNIYKLKNNFIRLSKMALKKGVR
jgi:lipopolysaccharide export system permease protein